MIWRLIGALVYVSLRHNAGRAEVEQREWGGAASFPVDAFEGISASQAKPYRHVRVMRVMGLFWWGIINSSAD